ncbi:MAG: pyridoxamine 5'-phosphate oxidase [bacterium]|jgi:pyridoxamine 5'-phosphate oxidase|nr:pyridoxamine 5'-phosphate oxidase [Betaproteobacteria bacterium]
MDIANLRKDYTKASLDVADVEPDPLRQFGHWLQQSIDAEVPEPTAMTLATVDASGQPSARIVLLKGFDASGLTLYTNYLSRKGRELAANPKAALLFHWVELERQVRIEGRIEQVPQAESDAYYVQRPLGSRIGAWASPQSEVIADRALLEQRYAEAAAQLGDQPKRPPHWGGYRLIPEAFEFWQGRSSRLHDRVRYVRALEAGGGWYLERLAP